MRKILIIIWLCFPAYVFADNYVSGRVFGKDGNGKQPLPSVNIYWQGTTSGITSDSNGEFRISKSDRQHMLVFSFVGYSPKTVHIEDSGPIEVILEPDLQIEEVTVLYKDRGTYLSAMDPVHTVRIGGAELHKAACCNLSESFETNPSVDVGYSDAVTGAKQIRLLGLDGAYTQMQIENMPNLRGLATNFGLTYIPGPWMESISVSKGASSVVSGYESIAGQINADFKKPDANEKLFLNLFTSAHGMNELNANANLRIYKDVLTSGLFVHAADLSKRNDHNMDGFLDEPLLRRINLLNRWKYNNFKGFMAQAGVSILNEDRLGGQVDAERGMENILSNPYGINIRNNRFEGFLKSGYTSADSRSAIAFLSNFARHTTNAFYGLNDFNASEIRFYANVVFTRDLDPEGVHSTNSGISFIYDKFREDLYNVSAKRNEQVPGIFTEYTLKPNENFTLLAGIRSDFHNIFGTFLTPRMHLRYKFADHFTFRMNAGKGYRTANVISENTTLLASSRQLVWSDEIFQEEAWNFGFSLIQDYQLMGRDLQINAEYFHTNFQSQLVTDRETSPSKILLSPLDGKSYAGSLQFDVKWQPVNRLDLLVAYRVNDVKQTIGGKLMEKPLTSRYKGLITMNYTTKLKKWMFDYTLQLNGGGRIPRFPGEENGFASIPDNFYDFLPFTAMNAQITKYFRNWNIYFGSENFTDVKQKHPVQHAENPYGPYFDATNVWGPVLGRRTYLGIRFNLNYQ